MMTELFSRVVSRLSRGGFLHRRSAARPLAVAACALLLACGSKSSQSSPPSISNLLLSPQSATVNDGGGRIPVSASFDFSDSGADITQVEVTLLDSTGTQLDKATAPVQDPPGVTTGTFNAQLNISTAVIGSYTVRFRVSDAGGSFSNALQAPFVVNPQGTSNPYPTMSALSPSSAVAGGPAFALTVTGSGFVSSSVVQWNGLARTTTFVSDTEIQAQILASDVASQGSAWVSVYNPPPGGGYASSLMFTVGPPGGSNPYPTLSALSPSSAVAGGPAFAMTVTGSGFVSGSVVQWNGSARTTTFVSDTEIQAQILASDVASQGSAWVSVYNPPPGGGYSSSLTFTMRPPPQPGVTFIDQRANDLAWDPYQRKIYLSVPSLAPTNPNTITVLDPFAGALGTSMFAGSEPDVLAVSDDGEFLYAGIDGAASVRRFRLPDLAQDLAISLGADSIYGPYVARDLQVAPARPHTTAVSLGNNVGGVVVFDDGVPRATRAGVSTLYTSLQWGPDATRLYALDYWGSDFYTFTVDPTGVVLDHLNASGISGYGPRLHYDYVTGLVYVDSGAALDPATGLPAGTFAAHGPMVPDPGLNTAFFLVQPYPGTSIESFDLTHFTPTASMAIDGVPYNTAPRRLIRWGQDGVAFLTAGQVVLIRGEIVLPVSATPNPSPSIGSTSPPGITAGSGNFMMVVTGTGFVPGSVVQWNGGDRTTRFASATQLVAYVLGSDVASPGSAQVAVVNPAPGGGTSPAATFVVSP